MPSENTAADPAVESAIALEALERVDGFPLAQLRATIVDVESSRLERALANLQSAGVVSVEADRLYPAPALTRLDEIGLVHI
jgi:hypothetical protein